MNSNYFLKTKRLGFRKWHEDDFDIANGIWGDFEVTKLIDTRGALSKEQVQEKLKIEIERNKEYGVQYWPIFLLETGENVGCCGLRPREISGGSYEIGFHVCQQHWRHGYAFEAAQAVIHYAFTTLKASSLFAGHNPNNEGSRQLLTKLGFRFTHDEFYMPTGLNHLSYEFTKENYVKLYSTGTL